MIWFLFSIKPPWPFPMVFQVSNDIQTQMMCGYVTVKAKVVSVTDTSVHFSDGSCEQDIDVIVCATGYDYRSEQLAMLVIP